MIWHLLVCMRAWFNYYHWKIKRMRWYHRENNYRMVGIANLFDYNNHIYHIYMYISYISTCKIYVYAHTCMSVYVCIYMHISYVEVRPSKFEQRQHHFLLQLQNPGIQFHWILLITGGSQSILGQEEKTDIVPSLNRRSIKELVAICLKLPHQS